jgi:hypothetical protein
MAARKLAATILAAASLVAVSVFGLTSPASAATRPDSAAPESMSCRYTYVCGRAANGNSFAYARCGQVNQLPNLVGRGPLYNNQTRGTVATFYGRNGQYLFSSRAPEKRTVNWTPVWFVRAC